MVGDVGRFTILGIQIYSIFGVDSDGSLGRPRFGFGQHTCRKISSTVTVWKMSRRERLYQSSSLEVILPGEAVVGSVVLTLEDLPDNETITKTFASWINILTSFL